MISSDIREETLSDQRNLDLDLHGVVRIRLIDPLADDAARLERKLGLTLVSPDQEPDIIIRFKEELSVPVVRYLGLNSAAFTEEGFYILDKNSGRVQARIPFEQIGCQCEILCRSGLSSIPLLFEIILLTFVKKGYIPLHASAFLHRDNGILVMGWAKGGKTEMLLSFANHGAQYVGDEWVMLSADGQEMFGIPITIAIRDWQIPYIPNLLPKIDLQSRILFKVIHSLDAMHKALGRGRWKNSFLLRSLGRALPRLRQQLMVRRAPQVIFRDRYCKEVAPVDKVFLIMSHSEADITVQPCDPLEIARRMLGSIEYEQTHFFEYYYAFKYAFPHRQNDFLEEVYERQGALLRQALQNKEAYQVLHPYPVPFDALFEEIRPFCEKTTTEIQYQKPS
jgi:hypothetical protein